MDPTGYICSEWTLDKQENVLKRGLEYERSSTLTSIPTQIPPKDRATWVTEVKVHSENITFSQNCEDQVTKTRQTFITPFHALTLEKVNNDADGDYFTVQEDFYLVLNKMLRDK